MEEKERNGTSAFRAEMEALETPESRAIEGKRIYLEKLRELDAHCEEYADHFYEKIKRRIRLKIKCGDYTKKRNGVRVVEDSVKQDLDLPLSAEEQLLLSAHFEYCKNKKDKLPYKTFVIIPDEDEGELPYGVTIFKTRHEGWQRLNWRVQDGALQVMKITVRKGIWLQNYTERVQRVRTRLISLAEADGIEIGKTDGFFYVHFRFEF